MRGTGEKKNPIRRQGLKPGRNLNDKFSEKEKGELNELYLFHFSRGYIEINKHQ